MIRLKRAVIKEELIAITDDYVSAIILNQFIYWSERIKDFDMFINEENKRSFRNGVDKPIDLTYGWIYKSAKDLKDEIMIEKSDNTILRAINNLIEKGFLLRRNNPKYKWDKTYQYRVEITTIQATLQAAGYSLEGYKVAITPNLNGGDSELQNCDSYLIFGESSVQNREALPEIITNNTPETTTKSVYGGNIHDWSGTEKITHELNQNHIEISKPEIIIKLKKIAEGYGDYALKYAVNLLKKMTPSQRNGRYAMQAFDNAERDGLLAGIKDGSRKPDGKINKSVEFGKHLDDVFEQARKMMEEEDGII